MEVFVFMSVLSDAEPRVHSAVKKVSSPTCCEDQVYLLTIDSAFAYHEENQGVKLLLLHHWMVNALSLLAFEIYQL